MIPSVAPRYGGPSDAALRMVAALETEGLEVLLATTDADGPGRLPVRTGEPSRHQGSPTIFFPRLRGESLKPSPALAKWLRSETRAFDLVHIHSVFSHPSLAAGAGARASGIPYVVRPLGQLDPWSLSQHAVRKKLFLAGGGRRLLRRAAALHWTDVSERKQAPSFVSDMGGFVLPLGVDERLFDPRGKTTRRDVLLFLSRLHPKKNVEGLLEAFSAVAGDFEAWELVIAGDGDPAYVARLKALSVRAESAGRVKFVGWLDAEAKREALSSASLFALPSRQENFGVAVAEAMAVGTPVVVSEQVALAAEVARAGAGWVAPSDGEGLARTLRGAMRSAGERASRGAAARALAEERFRWAAVGKALVHEYEEILRSDRRPR